MAALLLAGACGDDSVSSLSSGLRVRVQDPDPRWEVADKESDRPVRVDMGARALFAVHTAEFAITKTGPGALALIGAAIEEGGGAMWGIPTIELTSSADPRAEGTLLTGPENEDVITLDAATDTAVLRVTYSPTAVGEPDRVLVRILLSNRGETSSGSQELVEVAATGVFTGAPDITLAYSGIEVPNDVECFDAAGNAAPTFGGTAVTCRSRMCGSLFDVNGTPFDTSDDDIRIFGDYAEIRVENGVPDIGLCRVPSSLALDLGNIGLGGVGNARLAVRNDAVCPADPTVSDPIDACRLQVTTFQFAPELGELSFFGSTATPFYVRQQNIAEYGEDGVIEFPVVFNAPAVEGEFSTNIEVVSNDPDEPRIILPVRARSADAPVCVARLRACSLTNPPPNCTEADSIRPFDTVWLDGSGSFDPGGGTIADYEWEIIEKPIGTDPAGLNPQSFDQALARFTTPLAGQYTVRLRCRNDAGIEGGDTDQSRVELEVRPGAGIHVQLVWNHATNDQDLHLTYVEPPRADLLCAEPWDTYYGNTQPQWFASDAAGVGPNPRLDVDDTNGLGPENINIDTPAPGTYHVYVHHYTANLAAATQETVRIFFNGSLRAEYRCTLDKPDDVWAVAAIVWNADGTGLVAPFLSDGECQFGQVAENATCGISGWAFPFQ